MGNEFCKSFVCECACPRGDVLDLARAVVGLEKLPSGSSLGGHRSPEFFGCSMEARLFPLFFVFFIVNKFGWSGNSEVGEN